MRSANPRNESARRRRLAHAADSTARGAPPPATRTAAAVRMLGVLARQLHHPYAAESLLQPLNDLLAERIDTRLPSPRRRLPIDGLAQCAGDRVLTAPQLAGNLAQAL